MTLFLRQQLVSTCLLIGLCIFFECLEICAATLPSGFVESRIANGLTSPTAMAVAPDGRIFICEQGGAVKLYKNGVLSTFGTFPAQSIGERGLLGIALDPAFSANGFVYLYYTVATPTIHNRVTRVTAVGDVLSPGSEVVLLDLDTLSSSTILNGGGLNFGLDGKLYIATGCNSVDSNSQLMSNLHGKLLRINPDGTIPTDNPFYSTASGKNRAIWALGLRNPYTFTVHAETGRIFINDVGKDAWEEINDGFAGANYGWPTTEGFTSDARFRSPVFAYPHSGPELERGCAVTGGVFYAPAASQFPASYVGKYFFMDYCIGYLKTLDPANGNAVALFGTGLALSPVYLTIDQVGNLYYLSRGSGGSGTGSLYRISYTLSHAPAITSQPKDQIVAVGRSATFRVSASGSSPLRYQWQRNRVNISGATSSSYTLSSASTSDNGAKFRCIVSNAFGSATSNEATLTVTSSTAPTGTIVQPAAGTLYAGGDTIVYSGTATDPQDGSLPASAFTWWIDFHHDTHTHPFLLPTSGSKSGSVTIPNQGETSANVWYRIYLRVQDSSGLTHTSFVDVMPRTSTITLDTLPSGLQVTLDGQPRTTPFTFTGVVGIVRSLGAVTPQTLNGTSWAFDSWSDGGAANHNITTPSASTTYTAVYRVNGGSVGAGNGLKGDYFDNVDFTGTMITRTDSVINFDWGTGSPASGIGPDTFSVRWTGTIQAQFSETYTFYTLSDDGVRLWVNDRLIINNWTDHAATENSGTISLTAGTRYAIRMEFYDRGGGAVAKLMWSSASTPKSFVPKSQLFSTGGGGGGGGTPGTGDGLTGVYYDNLDFTGATATRVDTTVNYDWGTGAPAPGIGPDTFSVRWTGQVQAQFSETYTFYTISDDGVRLWVNNQLIINNWTDHAGTENSGTIALVAGLKYDIRMEFYDRSGGAIARLSWSSASTAKQIIPQTQLYSTGGGGGGGGGGGSGLSAAYYDNINFTGAIVSKTDTTVNFDWGYGAPVPGIGPETFSVRWTGEVLANFTQTYTFYTVSDDGVRLWVNNVLIIDNWTDHGPTENSGTISLVAGQRYAIRMEYYENINGAVARLLWSSPSTPKQVIPQAQLFP